MTISNEELARPTRHVFLSPHYDDIALSVGGTASSLSAFGRCPEISLIFGSEPDPNVPMTWFADELHEKWGLSAQQVIAGRRAEESIATRVMGVTERFLPFRDAIYRGERYLGDEQLFSEPVADEADLAAEIVRELDTCSSSGTMRWYAPLAVGGHADHHHGFRTGVLLANRGEEVWFYEDLPYSLKSGQREARIAAIEASGMKVREAGVVDVSEVWQAKIDAIMAYPSQLHVIFTQYVGAGSSREEIEQVMHAYADACGNGVAGERFWQIQP